jgi:hypothetical protein
MKQNFKNVKNTVINKRPYLPSLSELTNMRRRTVQTDAIPNAPKSY